MLVAAVIPAPVAYIKVVAVKKLVVGFLIGCSFSPSGERQRPFHPSVNNSWHLFAGIGLRYFTLRKLECFRQVWSEYISME